MNKKKEELIRKLVSEGYLKDPGVIKAFERVPREEFIEPRNRDYAYMDYPVPIPRGQTISAPHMCAAMVSLLDVKHDEKILEIGAGSGYNAALISELLGKKGKLITIEFDPELAEFAKSNLERTGYGDVEILIGDGSKGYSKEAPYDKIIVTCATPKIFDIWLEQLKIGGIIVAPIGGRWRQELTVAKKTRKGIEETEYGGCVFVPLR